METTFYYIDEIQNRADGICNVVNPVQRSSLAAGLSYYYERRSKLVANTEFTSACLGMRDNHGNQIQPWEEFATAYSAE